MKNQNRKFTKDIPIPNDEIKQIIQDNLYQKSMQNVDKLKIFDWNDIGRKLKLQKNEIISLRNKGIYHFKHNLKLLCKAENLKKGGKN